jgi:hypothetical protein
MIAATVIFKASTLSDPLHAIISSFRAPEYEQFDAGTGLRIAVTYARDASIQLLSISANASPLARDHFSLPIEQDAAETLLHELLPKSVRSGEPQRSVRAFGAFISKRERYRHATIFRNYSDGHMIAVGASWPIDPSLVNAGGSK